MLKTTPSYLMLIAIYQKGGTGLKELLKSMRKNWITVWFIVCIVACTSLISYAAFTRINTVKRVVSTDAGAGARFSSDSMDSSAAGMTSRKSFYSRSADSNAEVHIFNYPYPKASLYRNTATEYDVEARIGTHDGTDFSPLTGEDLSGLSSSYYINYNGGTNSVFNSSSVPVTFENCIMNAGKVDPDCFNVHFDSAELSDTPPGYCVEMTAVPRDTSLPTLKGYIYVRYIQTAESGWTGSLEELDNDKVYDGYNYILEGSGEGRITFSWNPEKLTINKQFLQNPENRFYINETAVNGSPSLTENSFSTVFGMKSITLVVDSQDKNRYEVQFYKTDTSGSNDYRNSVIKNYLPDSSNWVETGSGS